jgi:hypothetical protein
MAVLGELDAADPRTLVLEAEPRPVVSVPEGGLAEVAAALPDARIEVVEGQQHVADALAPELVAGHLVAFLGGRR